MWLLLGLVAIICAFGNILCTLRRRDAKYFRFSSLSLTALTVCAFYHDSAQRVLAEDWSGLMDILPTGDKVLWFCAICSILVNSISLFSKAEHNYTA